MAGSPPGAGKLVGQTLGKYQLLALLAVGGTAEIYLARIDGTAGFEKYVVVKCLHDHLADDIEFVRMFLDEARLGAQLDHSNIVQTLELGEHHGRYFLVMEYLAGLSLQAVARKAAQRAPGGRIPVHLVLGLAAQACAGLHYAHERTSGGQPLNIVHRDVSPQNLVISFEGVVKVVDFGIAKAELRQTQTRSGTIKGKFAYMSPEQCLSGELDRRTDVFALGVVVHELLTGRRLFKRASTYDTYQAIIDGVMPTPSAMGATPDPAIEQVVMTALAYDREARFPTAEAFGESLIGLLHQRGKAANAGDLSRFVEDTCAAELEEQLARMRALLEGRRATMTGISWDVEGESDAGKPVRALEPQESESLQLAQPPRRAPPPPPGARPRTEPPVAPSTRSLSQATMAGSKAARAGSRPAASFGPIEPPTTAPTVSAVIEAPAAVDDEWGAGSGDDELAGEATRIEVNPHARIAELHARGEAVEAAATPPAPAEGDPAPARVADHAAQGKRRTGSHPNLLPSAPRAPAVVASSDNGTPAPMLFGGAAKRAAVDDRAAIMTPSPASLVAPRRAGSTSVPPLPPIPAPGIQTAVLGTADTSPLGFPAIPAVPAPPRARTAPPVPPPAPSDGRDRIRTIPMQIAELVPLSASMPTVVTAALVEPAPIRPLFGGTSGPAQIPTVLASPDGDLSGGAILLASEPPPMVADPLPTLSPTLAEMPMPAHLMGFETGQIYPDRGDVFALAAARRRMPSWMLALLFVAALAIGLGLTVALARAITS